MATQGAPGTGKSFFGDEVAEFREEDIESLCDEDMRYYWRDIVSVTVTDESPSTNPKSTDSTAEVGLALRMLWRYLEFTGFSISVCIAQRHQNLAHLFTT